MKMPRPSSHLLLWGGLPWHLPPYWEEAATRGGHAQGLRQTASISGPRARDEGSGEFGPGARVFPGPQATPADALWGRHKLSLRSPAKMAAVCAG